MYNGHAVRIADLVTAGWLAPGAGVEFTRQGSTTKGIITPEGDIQVAEQLQHPFSRGHGSRGARGGRVGLWRVRRLATQSRGFAPTAT